MSRGFQFSLKALLIFMLVVAAFVAGIRFGSTRQLRKDEADIENAQSWVAIEAKSAEEARAETEATKVEVIRLMNKLEKLTRKKDDGPTTD